MADTTWLKLTGQVPMFGSFADPHGMGMSYIGGTCAPQCCACNGTCCHTGPHTYCARHGGSLAVPSPPSLPDPNLSSHVARRCPVCQGSGRWYGPLGNHTGGEECHGCLGRGWVVV